MESEIFCGFCVLAFWKAEADLENVEATGMSDGLPIEANGGQIRGRKGKIGWIHNFDLRTLIIVRFYAHHSTPV